jgi:GT2 family glycosyltransferase
LENKTLHKIAVIIVNYNVEHFLEQCLNSVRKALNGIDGEVFMVDNHSIDSSVDTVKAKFPEVKIIANKSNVGFSCANNQAISVSSSEYILLLNPDTVVEEDTFRKVIDFMDRHPEAGGLGVRMVDGKGRFLPESKRGLPTPLVAFYKIFGLSRLFPGSKLFGQYHAGHLGEFEVNETQVLSGAFMLMRNTALEKVGLLDESFFMYGEDIDLSYRILKGGYKNYYFPETTIIHYKGESTKKSSVNYVFVFYKAMVIFARKHFSQKNARIFSSLIHLAIYFRAALALLMRFIKKATLPSMDAVILLLGLFAMTLQWQRIQIDFPDYVRSISIPSYLGLWMTGVAICGGYENPLKVSSALRGTLYSTLVILIIYALLPKTWQFSRLFILTGALWVIGYYILSRIYLHFSIGKQFRLTQANSKRFAVVGDAEETKRVSEIIRQTGAGTEHIFRVEPYETRTDNTIGNLSQLDQIVFIHHINEVVFCAKNVSAGTIITWMCNLGSDQLDFKIAQPDTLSLIGSNSIDTAGEHYVLNVNSISNKENSRKKRILDLILSSLLMILYPFTVWFFQKKWNYVKNIVSVWSGKKSFVGYGNRVTLSMGNLPKIRPGIVFPSDEMLISDPDTQDKLDLIYARDYSIRKDLKILLRAWKKLDR